MSRTYIGPFGRILPVLPDTEPLRSEETHAPIEGNLTTMATYQLPPPTGLQFGSDPFHGFVEHNRYDAVRPPRSSCEQPRTDYQEPPRTSYREQLPSVSQLLTPGSQSSIPTSPYSPQYSPDSPEPRATQITSRRCNAQESPLQVTSGYPLPGGYPTAPSSQHYVVEHDVSVSNGYQAIAHQPQTQNPTINHASVIQSPYVHFAPEHRQDTYIHQPRPIAPLTEAAHYYQAPTVNYDQPMGSTTASNQGLRIAGNIVKPLPRLVGEKVVPGEGPCWVYEDGSICRKVIDGEEVNAQWGVTKAGKPRKRLAIACTTCREKKIKCDPAEPKCVQCEKFGRVCRFTTA